MREENFPYQPESNPMTTTRKPTERRQRFDQILRERRAQTGISQSQLAALAGVSEAYIGMLETGRRSSPSHDVLQNIADALGTDVGELVAALGETTRQDPAAQNVETAIRHAPDLGAREKAVMIEMYQTLRSR